MVRCGGGWLDGLCGCVGGEREGVGASELMMCSMDSV